MLEPLDVGAARDVMLEALHTSLHTDPLGESVTVRDVARAIVGGPRPSDGGDELTELVLDAFATRLIGDYQEAVPRCAPFLAALASGAEPDGRRQWSMFAYYAAVDLWDDERVRDHGTDGAPGARAGCAAPVAGDAAVAGCCVDRDWTARGCRGVLRRVDRVDARDRRGSLGPATHEC